MIDEIRATLTILIKFVSGNNVKIKRIKYFWKVFVKNKDNQLTETLKIL